MTKYELNQNFIFREDDNAMFDTQEFVVHNLNGTAMSIMSFLHKSPANVEEISQALNFPQEDCDEFVRAATTANMLIEV